MKKSFKPIADKCAEIVDFIMSTPEVAPLDESKQFRVRLCTEEAVENVVRYAYVEGTGSLEAGTEMEGDYVTITLKDSGIPFDPLKTPDPDISLSAEAREIGGLGIFLCKRMMDEVYYSYVRGCNVLKMKLKI